MLKKEEKKQKKNTPAPAASRGILVEGDKQIKEEKKPKTAITESRAILRFLRISPRKVKLVIDEIRGLAVDEALAKLKLINKKAVTPVLKLVNSAIANAEHNFKLKKENLYIKAITANQGPTIRRSKPAAFGSAHPIRKRTTHLLVTLAVREVKENLKNKLVKKEKLVKAKTKQKSLPSKPNKDGIL